MIKPMNKPKIGRNIIVSAFETEAYSNPNGPKKRVKSTERSTLFCGFSM
jgi:hypothetical protein